MQRGRAAERPSSLGFPPPCAIFRVSRPQINSGRVTHHEGRKSAGSPGRRGRGDALFWAAIKTNPAARTSNTRREILALCGPRWNMRSFRVSADSETLPLDAPARRPDLPASVNTALDSADLRAQCLGRCPSRLRRRPSWHGRWRSGWSWNLSLPARRWNSSECCPGTHC